MTKISITRALATVKTLEAKIVKATSQLQVGAVLVGVDSNQVVYNSAESIGDTTLMVEQKYQALQDMIVQRDTIKRAVIMSNATTKVTIGNKVMTVAEAIEAKRSIELRTQVLARLKASHREVTMNFNKLQAQFDASKERLQDTLSGKDKKVTAEEIEMQENLLTRKSKPSVLDPLKAASLIETLEAELYDFVSNVDFSLSESNARTEIEI